MAEAAWLPYDKLTFEEWDPDNDMSEDEQQTEPERRADAATIGEYALFRVPKAIPDSAMLTHNHARPAHPLGMNGFRAWLEPVGRKDREVCPCGWAPALPVHYRVASIARRRASGTP
jgi:hypothetical protein